MLRNLWIGLLVTSLVAGGVARASDPTVSGNADGLEVLPQTVFNPAVFVGVFHGEVGGKPALGVWGVAINHGTPLPDDLGESVTIVGQWELQVWVFQSFRLRRVGLSGDLAGTLSFVASDLFAIDAVMNVTGGGSGPILLSGILDHTKFPPGVTTQLSQP